MRVFYNGKAVIMGDENIDLGDFPKLKVLGCNMTGLDHLPLKECEEMGIKVISLKGETEFLKTVTSTAEHTIGLIISLLRNYKVVLNAPYQDRDAYKGYTLAGKMLGIIGYGRVGNQVSKMAKGLGMEVRAIDTLDEITTEKIRNEALQRSDIISLHIPLQRNEGFFTKVMFEMMKPSSYFINTSRSKVVEDGALIWALKSGIIKGAAVDFIDDPELCEYAENNSNLILTNHMGGNTFEDRERTEKFIEQKVEDYINQIT